MIRCGAAGSSTLWGAAGSPALSALLAQRPVCHAPLPCPALPCPAQPCLSGERAWGPAPPHVPHPAQALPSAHSCPPCTPPPTLLPARRDNLPTLAAKAAFLWVAFGCDGSVTTAQGRVSAVF